MRKFKILFVTFVIVAFSLVYMLAAQEAKNTNKQSLMDQVNERYPDGVGRWRELFLDDDKQSGILTSVVEPNHPNYDFMMMQNSFTKKASPYIQGK